MIFLDTSVLVLGIIHFGPQSEPAQALLDAVARGKVRSAATAWHCCLELYSVATRLPPEFRLTPAEAAKLLETEIFSRLAVHDLPASERRSLFQAAASDAIAGGRIYDAHIGEVARAAGAEVVVTENRRHFLGALRHGMRVETPAEFVAGLGRSRS